jgi:RNase P/RNase MRP subunit POP5
MESNIQVIAQEKLKNIVEDGRLEAMVEKQLVSTMQSIIGDVFRDYSDFGKELKKVLQEKMQVNLDNIALGTYNNMVCRVIEESMTGILEEKKDAVKKTITSLLQLPEKKEWKLSEIVAKYRESLYEYPEVVINIEETEYGHTWANIGEKEKKSYSSYSSSTQSYDIRMIIDKKTNKISNVWFKSSDLDIRKARVYDHSLEGFLMQLWSNDCVIELDEDDAEYEATKDEYED